MAGGYWVAAAWIAGLLLAGGCSRLPAMPDSFKLLPGSGTIHVDVPDATPSQDPIRIQGAAVSLAVSEFADARPGSPGRKVGNIRATVRDMHATELALDQDVSSLLASAARSRLVAEGFRVVPSGVAADFSLDAVVRTFTLDIAGRDELAIVVDATLRAGTGTEVAWKGVVAERSDRYAGVSGNSSASIAEYLGEGVAAFAGKLGAAVKTGVVGAPPRPGAARPPEAPRPVSAPPPPAPAPVTSASPRPPAAATQGRLWVNTVPARAKVYIDEVYYGLAPLKVEIPAGIVQVRIVLGGFRTVTEKVSVRTGDTTELEVALEK